MVSPIAYTVEMVPEALRPILAFNPLYYMIAAYQDCLFRGRFPSREVMAVLTSMSLLSFCGGYWFFSRMKKVFVDNV
jgi:lipopolysaccharide transport system permease protein